MTELRVESGVAFPDQAPDAEVRVSATFLNADDAQMQLAIIGTEPVLLVRPEFDADENVIDFVVTAVDLNPVALVEVLEHLLDAARQMAEVDIEALAEIDLAEQPSPIPDIDQS